MVPTLVWHLRLFPQQSIALDRDTQQLIIITSTATLML